MSKVEEERAADLHWKSIVIQMRDPTYLLYRLTHNNKPGYFLKLRQAGVTAINVDVGPVEDNFRQAIDDICSWNARLKTWGADATLVTSAEDIVNAKKTGKTGIIYGFQNASPIEDNLNLLEILHKLGVRILELTYTTRNLIGDSCAERTDAGLSKFGLSVVSEMNRLGVLIDLSHVGHKTTMDTMEASTQPVIFSHSNVRTICNHPRNLTDEQIKALAGKQGVMGISAFASFLRGGEVSPTMNDYIDHIDHVVKLVGIDHVGVGLDVGEDRTKEEIDLIHGVVGAGAAPKERYLRDLDSCTKILNITRALVARGYSDQEIRKILGENWLRVFRKVFGH